MPIANTGRGICEFSRRPSYHIFIVIPSGIKKRTATASSGPLVTFGQTEEDTVEHDDRRAHIRHAANLETTCRLVNSQVAPLKVRVRDVSRGGINFVVDRELPPGTLLRIDLPRPSTGGESVMLACVMHCRPQSGGGYSIGCSFSDELGDDELHEFGGRREPARSEDKRAWTRFAAHGFVEFETVPPSGASPHKAEIANISPNGIGLLLAERIEPGTVLDMLLKTKTGSAFDILACVVYLGSRSEGGWVAGCHFIRELEENDLKLLL